MSLAGEDDEWWRLYVRRDRKDIYLISPIIWGIFVTTRNKAKDEELDVKRRKWKHLGGSNLPQRKPICPLQVPLYAFTVSATLSKFGDKSLSYFQTFRDSGKLRVIVWARKEEKGASRMSLWTFGLFWHDRNVRGHFTKKFKDIGCIWLILWG